MSLIGYLLRQLVSRAADSVVDKMSGDPLAADGKPIDTTWQNEPETGLQLVLHRAELEPSQLREFLPRLRVCFDHGLEDSQLEILQHRVTRLNVKKGFHGYYSVVQRGEVTNLEIMIEHQLRGTFIIALRGIGPAMEVVRHEIERFQAQSAVAPQAAPVALAAVSPTPVPVVAPVAAEVSKDGILRLSPDRSAWCAQLPFSQGHVLGHPISVMVENKRQEQDIQPQQADHQLLMQIFTQLPLVIDQVVKSLVTRVEDPESLRSLSEPMIYLYAERGDPQSWTFFITQALPTPTKLAMKFRGVQLLG